MAGEQQRGPTRSITGAVGQPSRRRDLLVFYWVATVLVAVAFVVPGIGNLARIPHMARDIARLGYPVYFMTILGIWKVLGATVVLAPRLPRLKEWAYAGMIFDLTGAAISRAAMGDGAPTVIVPLVIAAVVLASWALRPSTRTLRASIPGFQRGEASCQAS